VQVWIFAQVGIDICAGLVWILVQVGYGYLRRLGMDICVGFGMESVPGKGGWCYLQLLNIFLVIPKNKRVFLKVSILVIPLTTS
jgi:hypothetical protein